MPEFVLRDSAGGEFGRLLVEESGRATLDGDLRAEILPSEGSGHVMLTGGRETLTARPQGTSSSVEIRCGDETYEASMALLRNTAEARPRDAAPAMETARAVGGPLTNLSYKATYDRNDAAALPIAVLLLCRLISLRRRAYRL